MSSRYKADRARTLMWEMHELLFPEEYDSEKTKPKQLGEKEIGILRDRWDELYYGNLFYLNNEQRDVSHLLPKLEE